MLPVVPGKRKPNSIAPSLACQAPSAPNWNRGSVITVFAGVSSTVVSPRGAGSSTATEVPLAKESAKSGAGRISSRIMKRRAAYVVVRAIDFQPRRLRLLNTRGRRARDLDAPFTRRGAGERYRCACLQAPELQAGALLSQQRRSCDAEPKQ